MICRLSELGLLEWEMTGLGGNLSNEIVEGKRKPGTSKG